jgi:hypothetical protein
MWRVTNVDSDGDVHITRDGARGVPLGLSYVSNEVFQTVFSESVGRDARTEIVQKLIDDREELIRTAETELRSLRSELTLLTRFDSEEAEQEAILKAIRSGGDLTETVYEFLGIQWSDVDGDTSSSQ